MKIVYVFDEDGFLDRPVLLDLVGVLEIPENRYTEVQPGDFIRARWTGGVWIEGADDQYLEYLEGLKSEKEATPLDNVQKELEKISGEKEETQRAVVELTEAVFVEINTIKKSIAELAEVLVNPPDEEPPNEEEPQPEEGGETNG